MTSHLNSAKAKAPEDLPEDLPEDETEKRPETKALLSMRVLLVDDSADYRELVTIFLTSEGAVVETAENGLVALDRLKTEIFDVVLMDIQMPVLDGQSAMRELNARSYQSPVIALTASAMQRERSAALTLGFAGYLTKPVRRAELISSVAIFRKSDPSSV